MVRDLTPAKMVQREHQVLATKAVLEEPIQVAAAVLQIGPQTLEAGEAAA